jgi:voltage-gated potassium channel
VDLLLGILLVCEFLGRMLAHRHPMHYLENGAALLDGAVICSMFVSALGTNLGFLRILRTVRLLRSYNVFGRLKRLSPTVARNEEVIRAALDLAVFVVVASSLVYVTQRETNPKIEDFVDALYFTPGALR